MASRCFSLLSRYSLALVLLANGAWPQGVATESLPNLAERLNAPPGSRVVMIHADDAGVTHSVNEAIEQGFANASISSASIIVPSPWFPEIAAFARTHPQYDFGIHLALTAEWEYLRWRGITDSSKISSLLDSQGFLWASSGSVRAHDRPEEVKTELRSQVERARQFGVPITHLDTHMNALLTTPELAQIYVDLGREYHLPVVIWRPSGRDKGAEWLRPLMQMVPTSFVNPFSITRKFPGPSGSLKEFPDLYKAAILRSKPDEVMEIVFHPGLESEELSAALGDGSFGASWRVADYRAMTSADMHSFMKQHQVHLVSWKQVASLAPSN